MCRSDSISRACSRLSKTKRARRECRSGARTAARCTPSDQRVSTFCRARGNAMVEVIVAMLALTPFILGIPLLGKQLDVKHKTFDAARYAVWEKTVWRNDGSSNRKGEDDISIELRDRTLGHPHAGMLAASSLRSEGISENPLWRDRHNERLVDYQDSGAPVAVEQEQRRAPVEVGYQLAPGLAYGGGPLSAIATLLQVDDLRLNQQAFSHASVAVGLRAVLAELTDEPVTLGASDSNDPPHPQLVQRANAAILSDTWSARDENSLRRRVDELTTNELIESLELPGQPIAMQALGKGKPLYGEGQFAAEPDLRPRSTTLPSAYITRK